MSRAAFGEAMARLFHVSDLHFGRADEAALGWFADIVRTERPDMVVFTGDVTMRARAHEFAAAEKWLGALGVPVSVEVGNHDLPYFNPLARLIAPYARYRRLERAIERPLDLPGVWLVPLRTTARAQWRWNWSKGVVRPGGLARALDRLRACPPDRLALVACHHPLIDPDALQMRGRTRNGADALAALAGAGAHSVLSGHVHDPFDATVDAGGRLIRLIGAGTLSERLRATRPSFNELTIDGGRLALAVRTMA